MPRDQRQRDIILVAESLAATDLTRHHKEALPVHARQGFVFETSTAWMHLH